jgi:molecular chaperone GrpE
VPHQQLESQPGDDTDLDDGGFAVEIDISVLEDALKAVELREAEALALPTVEIEEDGHVDLLELASVEAELALEVEFHQGKDENEDFLGLPSSSSAGAEVRIRAMEAESERDELRDKMDDLSKHKSEIEAKLERLTDRASRAQASSQNAMEAQQVAEQRAKRLREALEKQQKDVERLLKRRKQDHKDQYGRGRAEAVLTLVEVLDNLVLALGHSKNDPKLMAEGVQMVVQQFEGNLKRLGVETVLSTRGVQFDPAIHEAITNERDSELETGQVVTTISRGYTIDGKLLRAARVCVANNEAEK